MDGRERLIKIMNSQGLNAKQLSERIHVSAGTISNIMGGRNKPSLEFLQSVAEQFPDLSHSWLFLGQGDMWQPGHEPVNEPTNPDLFSQIEEKPVVAPQKSTTNNQPQVHCPSPIANIPSSTRTVQKIMIFYSDDTFEER